MHEIFKFIITCLMSILLGVSGYKAGQVFRDHAWINGQCQIQHKVITINGEVIKECKYAVCE